MEIKSIAIMRGPNYWSNYRKQLVVMKIDLQELENFPTHKIEGFSERIEQMLPSLYYHRCSEEDYGGFFSRVRQGTWMGHVIEHIALEIQTLAGMECGYGRTRSTAKQGVYNVIFSYLIEEAGRYAAEAAVRIADALVNNKPYELAKDIEELRRLKQRYSLGPSTQSIVDEAINRNIPYYKIGRGSYILFGQGTNQRRIRATMTDATGSIGVDIAGDKHETKEVLRNAHIPVPEGDTADTWEEAQEIIQDICFPLVIKPLDGNHGRGVTTNINNMEEALIAFKRAQQISETIVIEKYFAGNDYRFLVIDYKLVAVAKRTPAMIKGNGTSTIAELIAEVNKDPRRGDGHDNVLTKIVVDDCTTQILNEKNLNLCSVLENGQVLFLKDTANISSGGTARDVTDLVHPANVQMAERIARLIGLDICGIDIIAEDVASPITSRNGAIIEVNAAPGFRMHTHPSKGLARNVGKAVMDMLYPENKPCRIPIVAITGTNGKTTTTRLIAHMAATAGNRVGFTTTEGIYINNNLVHSGDCSGPRSAQAVLTDPTVNFAVLECARGGILKQGLGFDHCNISVVTNITEDHLGLKDIETLDDLARVKAVVPQSTLKEGYAILNADDDLVYAMRKDLDCTVALFSMDAENERVAEHCEAGGLAVILEKGHIVVCRGKWKTRVAKITDVPLSFNGKAEVMIKNILPATLAGILSNFSIESVRAALKTFLPIPEYLPGRLNILTFKDYEIMVDYAHNANGYEELKKFHSHIQSPQKIGIIAGVGDRRDKDIIDAGRYAAEIFDKVIIRHDKDLRGRAKEEIEALLVQGINEVNAGIEVNVVEDELEAVRFAMNTAVQGAFITVCTDDVHGTLQYLQEEKKKEETRDDTVINQRYLKAS